MKESFTSYTEALDWIHGLLRFGQKPGLERMNWLLTELGHPQRRLSFIHVAGTNGKGSTCAYLAHILLEAGYSVGMFSSPYLLDFRERIRYNNQMIPEADLVALANQLKPLVDRCANETPFGSPTEFEVITVLALLYFVAKGPAVVVWETGLGGEQDSTNVVYPLVSVITNVGLDHVDVLGHSISEIARQKAGVIKPGVPVVTGHLKEEALQTIASVAKEKRAKLYQLGREFTVESEQIGLEKQQFRYRSLLRPDSSSYEIRLNGIHQQENAAVALMTLDLLCDYYAYHVEEEDLVRGLQQTSWPGRLEVVSKKPLIILDGAHNPEGMQAFVQSLNALLPQESKLNLLIAALADKPLAQMAAAWQSLAHRVDHIYVTSFDYPRAAPTEMLLSHFHEEGFQPERVKAISEWQTFLRTWQRNHSDDTLIICGSLYYIAQVRAFLSTTQEAGE